VRRNTSNALLERLYLMGNTEKFLSILKGDVQKNLCLLLKSVDIASPEEIERLVVRAIAESKELKVSHESIKNAHTFPDLVVEFMGLKFGIEVKSSKRNNERSLLGNSIFETYRDESIKDIFLIAVLGRGAGAKIEIAEYGSCVSRIVVTHSPRYELQIGCKEPLFSIDQEEFKTVNILSHAGSLSYKAFSNLEPSKKVPVVKELLQKLYGTSEDAETVKWFLDESTPKEIRFVSWNKLSETERTKHRIRGFVFFPEVIGGKYDRFMAYLSRSQIMHPNVRDTFSSSSKNTSAKFNSAFGPVSEITLRNFGLEIAPYTTIKKLCLDLDHILDLSFKLPIVELTSHLAREHQLIDTGERATIFFQLLAEIISQNTDQTHLICIFLKHSISKLIEEGNFNIQRTKALSIAIDALSRLKFN